MAWTKTYSGAEPIRINKWLAVEGVCSRREADALIDAGLAQDDTDVEDMAARLDRLHREPESRSLQWTLGVDDEFADETRRRTELLNFIRAIPSLDRRQG